MAVKKSDFDGNTEIPDSAYFDFFVSGTNYKISKSNFLSALGVTGSLSQDGAITGVPVLDVSSAPDYLIRNIEAGDGILLSVSPENGITVEVDPTYRFPVNVESFNTSSTIGDNTDLVLSTGTHTLIMPATSTNKLEVKSISGTITLDPGSNTIENGNTVNNGVNRVFYLDGTVWLEL